MSSSTRPVPAPALLLLFVLSGAAGLIYEVVWARQLVLVFGNTSQAVSTILTGFFGGLAIGGAVGGRVADRVARPLRLYGFLELIVVAVVLLTPVTFRLIGEVYRGIYPALADAPLALALVRFALAILALAPATLIMGATLPTLTRYLTQGGRGIAGAFQRLYTANTVGAIVGHGARGLRADRAPRADRGAGDRGDLFRDRRRDRTGAGPAIGLRGGSRSGSTGAAQAPADAELATAQPVTPTPRRRPPTRDASPSRSRSCRASRRWASRSPGTACSAPGRGAPPTCSRSSWCCSWSASRSAPRSWAGSDRASAPRPC